MQQRVLAHFQKYDPVIYTLFVSGTPIKLTPSPDHFFSLVESIISQQLSVKAGDTIVKRFIAIFPNRQATPQGILIVKEQTLRDVGMSWSKVSYVRNIAQAAISNPKMFQEFLTMTDEEIIKELTKIKGIGQWTAEMFLMFALGREDVFSFGDIGLQNAIQKAYNYKIKPTRQDMEKLSSKWKPYRTYAARALWRSLG
jgi:DNA-3-methyladenine glycosylase II